MTQQALATVILIVAGWTLLLTLGYVISKKIKATKQGYGSMVSLIKRLIFELKTIGDTLAAIRSELVFMRTMTQAQTGGSPAVTEPPVGRRAGTTVQFPGAVMERYPVVEPDAKMEDTDQNLINQTDEDVMVAQALEEFRAKGIEIEADELPTHAVVEEA